MPAITEQRIKLQLSDFLDEIGGECCCLSFIQRVSDYFSEYFDQGTIFAQATGNLTPTGNVKLAQFLVYFHHIKSPTKMREIVEYHLNN